MRKHKTVISADYHKKPLWFKTINGLWKNSYPLGTHIKLDKDEMIKSARKQCDLQHLGDGFWEEPLDRLIQSVNEEAQLSPIGRFITKKRLENLLCVRLRAEHYFQKHPEILEQELYPTTVIMGLQRTGTTKLHRLLASDPDCRALSSWEALNPAPINGDAFNGDKRIKFAKMSENALKYMSPGFFAIHPVEHLAPEEDVLLLDTSFMSTTAEATMHVPSYSNWLEQTDQSIAYAYAAKLLKLLQWQKPAKKWVLKTPHHLEFPHLVNQYFGEVQFVWTHRNVMECIPSFLSMMAYSRALFSNDVHPQMVAEHWVKKMGLMLNTALDFRMKDDNNKKFVDVLYTDLVNDSSKALSTIYHHRNAEIYPALSQIFKQTEINSPKEKYGKHIYRLEDFNMKESFIHYRTDMYQKFQKSLLKDQ